MISSTKPSIRKRMLVTLLGTAGLGVAVAGLLFFLILVRSAQQTTRQDLASLGEVLAFNAAPFVVFDSPEQAAKLLEGLRRRPDITGALILRADGSKVAVYAPGNRPALDPAILERLEGVQQVQGRLMAATPIRSTDGHPVGHLLLESDQMSFHRQVRLAAIAITITLLAVGGGILLLSLRLQRTLTAPILDLAQLAEAVADKQDFTLRASAQGTCELDTLAGAFNGMLAKIQVQDELLEDHLGQLARELQERKQAQSAQHESERKTRAIFDLSYGFVGLLSPDGILLEANRTALEFAGVTLQEVKGQPFWLGPWWRHSTQEQERLQRAISEAASGAVVRYESTQATADGTIRFVDFSLKPVLDEEGRVSLVIPEGRDITERRLAEETKDQLHAQLLQAQKMEVVGRLAGGVAHDFNNMLGVILGRADLAMSMLDAGSPVRASLEEISKAARHSADLTRQLLAFARKQTVAPRVLDLNHAVETTLQMLRRLIGEDIDLTWMPAASLWPLRMDPSQIDQVLANLCINARDAIQGVGKIKIETGNATLDATFCQEHLGAVPGDYVVLTVSDTGCGMTPDLLEHIFEPFFTTKEVGQGTGLGLATVYGIVRQNEGFLAVTSEPGLGSTFRIYLPRTQLQESTPTAESATCEAPKGQGETLLVVEDDDSLLRLAVEALESLGYRVLAMGSPREALDLPDPVLKNISLLITDVVMPGMNGLELADRLGQRSPGLKCLFVSGYSADIMANEGFLPEGLAFLQKPFSIHSLAIKVRDLLTPS